VRGLCHAPGPKQCFAGKGTSLGDIAIRNMLTAASQLDSQPPSDAIGTCITVNATDAVTGCYTACMLTQGSPTPCDSFLVTSGSECCLRRNPDLSRPGERFPSSSFYTVGVCAACQEGYLLSTDRLTCERACVCMYESTAAVTVLLCSTNPPAPDFKRSKLGQHAVLDCRWN